MDGDLDDFQVYFPCCKLFSRESIYSPIFYLCILSTNKVNCSEWNSWAKGYVFSVTFLIRDHQVPPALSVRGNDHTAFTTHLLYSALGWGEGTMTVKWVCCPPGTSIHAACPIRGRGCLGCQRGWVSEEEELMYLSFSGLPCKHHAGRRLWTFSLCSGVHVSVGQRPYPVSEDLSHTSLSPCRRVMIMLSGVVWGSNGGVSYLGVCKKMNIFGILCRSWNISLEGICCHFWIDMRTN